MPGSIVAEAVAVTVGVTVAVGGVPVIVDVTVYVDVAVGGVPVIVGVTLSVAVGVPVRVEVAAAVGV